MAVSSRLLVIGDMSRVDLTASTRQWTISNYGTATTPNGSFNIADETAGLARFRIDTDGSVTSFVSSKSPIYYDSNDTGYYLDGNSTSRLYGINLNILNGAQTNYSVANSGNTVLATPSGVNSGSAFIHFTGGSSIAPYTMYRAYGDWSAPYGIGWTTGGESSGIFQRFASNGTSFGDLIYYVGNDGTGAHSFRAATWESTTYNTAGSNQYNTELLRIQVDGSVIAGTRFYTPILYDNNDTNYYCDPNATSVLNIINGVTRIYTGYDAGVSNSVSCSGWFRSSGSSGWYNGSYDGGIYMTDSTWVRVYNNKQFYVQNYILSDSSVRSPIFYDSNDTGYYCDPNSTSNLSTIINNSGTAYFRGGQGVDQCCGDDGAISIGGNATKPPRIAWHSAGLMEGTIEGSATGWRKIYFYDQQGSGLGIHATGDIASNGNIIAYYSDRRLKEDFEKVTDHWNVIDNLTGYRFTWNKKAGEISGFVNNVGKREVGLVAQEVAAVYPEAVYNRTEGPEEDPYKTIMYDKFTPVFIEALKDLKREIELLKEENIKLKELVNER